MCTTFSLLTSNYLDKADKFTLNSKMHGVSVCYANEITFNSIGLATCWLEHAKMHSYVLVI